MKTKLALALCFVLLHSLTLLSAFAQTTVFTYQGRVQVGGTNFTGTGQFKFALVTSTNLNHTATASVGVGQPSGGYITGYTVTSGGSGYVTAPTVTVFGGGGSGATAVAHLSGDGVTSISVGSPGNGGYTSAPTVTIAPPPTNITYTTYWNNDAGVCASCDPVTAVSLPVGNGLFTVALGDPTVANMQTLNASVFSQPKLQVRIWFNDGASGFAALSPAQNLTPAPYAMYALNVSPGADITGARLNVGSGNMVSGTLASIAGGQNNQAIADYATVGGGINNQASQQATTVAGGWHNLAANNAAAVGGGSDNFAGGQYSTIAGGRANAASGDYSFAAGHQAQATNEGAFVWADNTGAPFASTKADQFLIRASGGVGIGTNNPATALDVNGTVRATSFSGSGAGLTSLNASQLTSGTLPTARLPGAVVTNSQTGVTLNGTFTGNGAGLTNLTVTGPPAGVTPILAMIWINPATFILGSPSSEQGRSSDEGPQTVVTISKGFWMGHHEVTQGEYQAVIGSNPSSFTGDLNRPAETVSWNNATNYCRLLTSSERTAGRLPAGWGYRLPTEAEWEYACRAWTTTRFGYGDDLSGTTLTNYAWFSVNSGSTTHPMAQKLANPWGLVDMHGNVWEWCQDWSAPSYPGGSVIDPQGPGTGSTRVVRGGGWSSSAAVCRSAQRNSVDPGAAGSSIGFRVVVSPGQP